MDTLTLAVVVVSYDTQDLLRRCLDNLAGLALPFVLYVIVVDNDSQDGSPAMVRKCFPNVRLIANNENAGFARAVNQGIGEATGSDFILLLNSDAYPDGSALLNLVEFAATRPNTAVCGPQLIFENGSWQRSYGRTPSVSLAVLDALGITSLGHILKMIAWRFLNPAFGPRTVDFVDGACLMIRRSALDVVGLLDERYFMFVEDVEFCLRCRQHGFQVYYVPTSHVIHLRGGSSTSKNPDRTARLQKASLRLFFDQHYPPGDWETYTRWMRLNYHLRYGIARVLQFLRLIPPDRAAIYLHLSRLYATPDE